MTDKYELIVNLEHELTYPLAADLWGSPSWQCVRANKLKMMGQRSVESYLHRPKEELYDLDKEAKDTARELGMTLHRASCVNDHPEFVAMVGELLLARLGAERGATRA